MLFCLVPNPPLMCPQRLWNSQPWIFILPAAAAVAQLQFWPIWFSGSEEAISARHFAQRVTQPQMAASANSQRRETPPDWAAAVRTSRPWRLDKKLCIMTCRQAAFFGGVGVWSFKFASDDKEQLQNSFVRCVSTHLVFFFISVYSLISLFKEPPWRPSLPRTHYALWSSYNLTSDTKWSTHNHIWSILNHPNRTRLLCYLSSIANQLKLHSLHKLCSGGKKEIIQMYMKRRCHYVSKYERQTGRRLASTRRLQNFHSFSFFQEAMKALHVTSPQIHTFENYFESILYRQLHLFFNWTNCLQIFTVGIFWDSLHSWSKMSLGF